MQSDLRKIVVLGTGGTIAGTATNAEDNLGYSAAQLGVTQLVASVSAAVPALAAWPLEAEQVAQIDSRDMGHAVWQVLAQRCAQHLARADVAGIVVTHGTDTLEETAYFLHRVLQHDLHHDLHHGQAPFKPLVLTAAMRPATSAQADGPQNLLDAVTVARGLADRGAVGNGGGSGSGVCVVMAGTVFHPVGLHKAHPQRADAFAAGDAGPLGRIDHGVLTLLRDAPPAAALGIGVVTAIAADPATWPRVDIVLNHAGADGRIVDALLAQGVDGLIAAGTGNGTLSAALSRALHRAQQAGVRVWRASRCASGAVLATPGDEFAIAGTAGAAREAAESVELSAVQARVELMLDLMLDPVRRPASSAPPAQR